MNVFKTFQEIIKAEIADLSKAGELPDGLDCTAVTTEVPRDPAHGDIATNAAMVLARQAQSKPRELAEKLASALARRTEVQAAEVAGPGFINLRLEDGFWHDRLRDALNAGAAYGDSEIGGLEKFNVEYVSANPTGPLHVGHVRGAVFGDALANLLKKAGFDVAKEYYVNDAGAQIDILARSLHLRYRQAHGEDIAEMPEGMYPGDYMIDVAQALKAKDGARWLEVAEEEWLEPLRRFAVDALMQVVRGDLASLDIEQDVFFSESSLYRSGRIDEALDVLREKDLIYIGVLDPPKGKKTEDWEPRPQTLFRATAYGDDVDRPMKKSDGSWTYFAADIAYHYDKYQRGFCRMINVLGADHGGYVKRMKAAVRALSADRAELDIRICQLVRVLRDGVPVRMSKRAGDFVTLQELVREVGRDVVRFIMLTRKNDAPLDFDFAKVTEQSKDNPVFYVQYAHARVKSVLRNVARDLSAVDSERSALLRADLSRLGDSSELALIKQIAQWPRQVEAAALAFEPHRIAFYLYDLASSFHALWNKGNDDPGLRFMMPDDLELTSARLAMIVALADVIASGLAVLGVEPVDEMR